MDLQETPDNIWMAQNNNNRPYHLKPPFCVVSPQKSTILYRGFLWNVAASFDVIMTYCWSIINVWIYGDVFVFPFFFLFLCLCY